MKLFDTQMAPNPRRVRIFLHEKGIDIPTQQIDIMGGENLQEEYLKINPRGLLPSLQFEDGTVLDESSAICRYFEEHKPEPSLLGSTPLEKAQIESWIRRIEQDGYTHVASMFRNQIPEFATRAIPGTNNTTQVPDLIERSRGLVARFYTTIEQHFKGNTYIVEGKFSAADITALCTIDFAIAIGLEIPEQNGGTKDWYAKISSRPSAAA